MSQEFDRDHWLASGWERGAFIDAKASQNILNSLPDKLREHLDQCNEAYLIPLLYDCALVDQRFDIEPWVQVVFCWPCDPDPMFKFGKNPRRYQFPVFVKESDRYMEVTALSFFQLDREALLAESPLKGVVWPDNGLNTILNWASERIRQPTFPDEWNVRMKAIDKRLQKIWKLQEFSENCSGVYLNIQPFKQIQPDEKYTVSVFVTVPDKEGRELMAFSRDIEPVILQRLSLALNALSNVDVA